MRLGTPVLLNEEHCIDVLLYSNVLQVSYYQRSTVLHKMLTSSTTDSL